MKKAFVFLVILLFSCSYNTLNAQEIFYEGWETGSIDPDIWLSWGSPLPVIGSPGFNSAHALNPNGDNEFGSGVISYENFTLSNGIRVEWWGKGTQSYPTWQSFQVGISPLVAEDFYYDPEPNHLVYIHTGAEYNENYIRYGVMGLGVVFSEPYPDDGWHHYGFEISQSGKVYFWRDRILKCETGEGVIDFSTYDDLPVLVAGRSYNDPQLIDNIAVFEGSILFLGVIPESNSFPRGGRLRFLVSVTNFTNNTLALDGWTDVTLPTGRFISPESGPLSFYLGPGYTLDMHVSRPIPTMAPIGGPYTYCVNVGVYPDSLIAQDCFEFDIVLLPE